MARYHINTRLYNVQNGLNEAEACGRASADSYRFFFVIRRCARTFQQHIIIIFKRIRGCP